ncbi:uncharacterized protein LOC122507258 [Leptopilina heterotoma]|uniref:uncharacterized protein LOC122507258 n=1 Tax=Leptopilina heterotoma TaxID=63436 RepID=UPI001CA8139C|nr:uncharacterized protein LOC122507258 [Leptopilina heterotoma]
MFTNLCITSLFKSLPKVPPYNGFVPAEKSFKLTFIQIFYKNADGVHSQNGSWQLTYNIDLPELWEPIGTEGHLFGEDNCKPSEENTEEMGTANAEDSEEDWF